MWEYGNLSQSYPQVSPDSRLSRTQQQSTFRLDGPSVVDAPGRLPGGSVTEVIGFRSKT